jgi:hypothetical protein
MLTHEKATALLAKARSANDGKPIANNTRLFDRAGSVAVRLHSTDVVTIAPDNSYTLNTGGWRAPTTKQRITEYAPCQIWQRKGMWYLQYSQREYAFADGCTLHADGTVTGAADGTAVTDAMKLRKAVAAYAKAYIAALYDRKIGAPGPGDCWGCYMKAKGADGSKAHGFMGADHIHSHVEEKYYVPSLLLRALETGASPAMKHDAACLLALPGADQQRMFQPDGGFVREQLQKAVRKYCLRELGLAS